jgi:hypothetical protein
LLAFGGSLPGDSGAALLLGFMQRKRGGLESFYEALSGAFHASRRRRRVSIPQLYVA